MSLQDKWSMGSLNTIPDQKDISKEKWEKEYQCTFESEEQYITFKAISPHDNIRGYDDNTLFIIGSTRDKAVYELNVLRDNIIIQGLGIFDDKIDSFKIIANDLNLIDNLHMYPLTKRKRGRV